MTNVRGLASRVQRKTVISDEEFQEMRTKAGQIKNIFFALRSEASLCVLRLTGKRREEVARLEVEDFKVDETYLHITFTLSKKRRGAVITRRATKSIPLTDPLTDPIIKYLDHLKTLNPMPEFFLPRVKSFFGQGFIILSDQHISGRQLFNLVRSTSQSVWCHLFRETVASDVIEKDPSIIGAFKVMRRLDLEDHKTGFRYLTRYASDIIERELQRKEDIITRK